MLKETEGFVRNVAPHTTAPGSIAPSRMNTAFERFVVGAALPSRASEPDLTPPGEMHRLRKLAGSGMAALRSWHMVASSRQGTLPLRRQEPNTSNPTSPTNAGVALPPRQSCPAVAAHCNKRESMGAVVPSLWRVRTGRVCEKKHKHAPLLHKARALTLFQAVVEGVWLVKVRVFVRVEAICCTQNTDAEVFSYEDEKSPRTHQTLNLVSKILQTNENTS